MDDDDLRDRFGDELTEALRSRDRARHRSISTSTRSRSTRSCAGSTAPAGADGSRRGIAAAVGAGGTAVIALHSRDAARVDIAAGPSTTVTNPPSFKPLAPGVADWTWVSADHGWALVRNRCGTNVCMALRETTDGGGRWATGSHS